MKIYLNGPIRGLSGKLGNVVASHWKGIPYLRSLPKKSNKPPTPAQLGVQARFALAIHLLSPIKEVLNLGYSHKKLTRMSGYNAAVKTFLTNNSITGTYPALEVDFSKLQLSRGLLRPLNDVTGSYMKGSLCLSWKYSENRFMSFPDDEVIALVYNQTSKAYHMRASVQRRAQQLKMNPGAQAGDRLHVWVFATSHDQEAVSYSQYIGQFNVIE
ncbi:hypothetical protein D9M68_463410 [compost metagenome]